MANEPVRTTVTGEEADQVSRALLVWLNEYPEKPVDTINFEYLSDDAPSMAISLIQGVYKTRRYIGGGYEAECQFKVIYRVLPGDSNNQRLRADELLNDLADWAIAREDKPVLGGKRRFRRLVSDSRAALFARYEDKTEDHQILMTMTYTTYNFLCIVKLREVLRRDCFQSFAVVNSARVFRCAPKLCAKCAPKKGA